LEGGDFRDIQTGIDDLVRRGIADSTRLAQWGGATAAGQRPGPSPRPRASRWRPWGGGAGLTTIYAMYSTNDLQRVLEPALAASPVTEAVVREGVDHDLDQECPDADVDPARQGRHPVPIGQAQEPHQGFRLNDVPVELVFSPRGGRDPSTQWTRCGGNTPGSPGTN
jgi:hypothetical protein